MLKRINRIRLVDIIINLSVSVLLFIVTYFWIAQPHEVSGASMEPTLNDRDFLVTERISIYLHFINRGDIVVFQSPIQPGIQLIKRVIGMPSERIMISKGIIYINGVPLEETYVKGVTHSGDFLQEDFEYTIGDDEYIVLGDNRIRSSDSRFWGGIKASSINGVVALRYWPLSRISTVLK